MRLSEEKIKQAILHPQLEIRQRGLRYFSRGHSEDEGVAPLVIQAVEKYGRDDAYHLVGGSVHLRHTEETIAWVIEELQDPAAEHHENYVFNLNRILCDADLALLLPRETEILETCRFYSDLKDRLSRRLELISWDEASVLAAAGTNLRGWQGQTVCQRGWSGLCRRHPGGPGPDRRRGGAAGTLGCFAEGRKFRAQPHEVDGATNGETCWAAPNGCGDSRNPWQTARRR